MSELKAVPNIFYLKIGSIKSRKCHVVSRVEDNREQIIIYKFYNKTKQSWYYKAKEEWLLLFELNHR